ncbi:MAG: YkuS family protein [Clostridiales bacterium]|nr:YkuS family protein [Clostridiales bacterium]
MKKKIAIEQNLTPVKDYLTEKGFKVKDINFSEAKKLRGYDAFVVTGLHSNFLGVQDTESKAVVINADGMTPEEVADQIDRIE